MTLNLSSQFRHSDLQSSQELDLSANPLPTSSSSLLDGFNSPYSYDQSLYGQSTYGQSTCSQAASSAQAANVETNQQTLQELSGEKITAQVLSQKNEDASPKKSSLPASSPLFSADESLFTFDEKFELLSAFLDDEVTEEERSLVNHWLASDVQLKRTYQKQMKLRKAMEALRSQITSD